MKISMNKCPECGKELPKESRFCPYCIYKFEQEENNSYAETCGGTVINKKIKLYILLVVGFFVCAIIIFLKNYGDINKKNHMPDDEQNTSLSESDKDVQIQTMTQHVTETTDSKTEQIISQIKETEEITSQIKETEETTSQIKETEEATLPIEKTEETTLPIEETEEATLPTEETEEATSPIEETEEITSETWGCSHIYTNVTCTKPSICELCGMVALEALGHDFSDAPICKDIKCNNCDYVRQAQNTCYYEGLCCEEGICVYCGEKGVKYHNFSSSGRCYDCDFVTKWFEMKETGETFNVCVDRWMNVTVGENYKFDTINDKNSEYYGKTVVGIPITYDKLLGEQHFFNGDYRGFIEGFDNKYIRAPFVSEYFNDGFQLFALQEEKAVTEYYYILYGGDGEYRIKFNDDPDNSHGKIVTIHIKK